MAEASLFVLGLNQKTYQDITKPMLSHINIGTGKEVTIREMAETMKDIVDFGGKITFDDTKPEGSLRKLIDLSLLSSIGWQYKTDLKLGLEKTYEWYQVNIK